MWTTFSTAKKPQTFGLSRMTAIFRLTYPIHLCNYMHVVT